MHILHNLGAVRDDHFEFIICLELYFAKYKTDNTKLN